MKLRSAGWAACTLLVCLVLAACGGSTATAPTAATSAPEAPTTAAATSAPDAPTAATTDATSPPTAGGEYIFGIVMVGPYNDGGWNQAHYEAGKYVEGKIPGAKMIYIDKVNPADKPNVTIPQVVDELIAQGAKFVITNSAEFADGTVESARNHPDVFFIHASGDSVLKGNAPSNMGNLMGRMEYGKMLSGCAAALQTETGKISYLGPLIDPETRRLVNSAYLGARYCWEQVRGKPAADLKFDVTWIGFWFNIPGVTLDPTKVVNDFFNSGSDVVMSGIDTTEALVEANKASQAGKKVFAAPYDFKDACTQAEQVCLGVPYFNWGPEYVKLISAAQGGQFKQSWDWLGPDTSDMNNPDTSIIGYVTGQALSEANKAELEKFRAKLLSGEVNLFTGPLNYQDGSVFVEAGKTATDEQIWYTEQLLEGIVGQSAAPQQ
ncbi:MAG TPA: BMP family ABC transporter substrate-binding protein [Roseiflexaceae bacterium]|nr:BMP family ABC transporter substrate-binding protein [Roseiflexaceae bacterium]